MTKDEIVAHNNALRIAVGIARKPRSQPDDNAIADEILAAFVPDERAKASHVGAPAIFALEQACQDVNDAFGDFGCYLVGSALHRPDWRDVDVRYIMKDDEFAKLFPDAGDHWEFDPRWLLLTVSISERLSKITGLPIDFQIQPQTHANKIHKKARHALGMKFGKA